MAIPVFHIAIDGPVGMTFQSFPSSALENGDPTKILLATIRNTCRMSNKLFFTIDGKSRIADSTTLAYYMSLTSEGQKILTVPSAAKQPADKAGAGNANNVGEKHDVKEGDEKHDEKEGVDIKEDEAIATEGIKIMTLKVSNGQVASTPRDLPAANAALSKLLDGISESKLEQGDLPTFTDRELASLKANYSVTAGPGTAPEPSDMTEEQWDKVFTNNRALHGYFYDFGKNILVKARKRAFKLKGAAPVGKPPVEGQNQDSNKDLPPIPPFYIADDASVGVTEISDQFQHSLTKKGFNSLAVSGSLGGGPASIPASVSASFEQEHTYINQTRTVEKVESLVVTYNFPRVVVELDEDSLELTKDCRRDAMSVSDIKSRDKFFRDYGSIFVSQFTLGGFLYSTRNVTSTETATLDQVKDRTRIAAGLSVQSPKASGSINVAKVDENSQDTGFASLLQNVRLTWDARGGDTLLCSNPSAWVNTVKNYQLWRLMDQQRLVKMEGLIQDIDTIVARQLESFDANNSPIDTEKASDAVIHDSDVNDNARINLMTAFSSDRSVLATKIQKLYTDGHYETAANIAPFNDLFKKNFPKEPDSLIKAGTKWAQLTMDQKIAFGIYLASLGQIQVV